MKIEDLRPELGENAEVIPGLAKALVKSKAMERAWLYLKRKKISLPQIYRIVLYAYEAALIELKRPSPEEEKEIFDGMRHHTKALAALGKRASAFQLGGHWWQFGYENSCTSSGKEVYIPAEIFWFYFDLPKNFQRDENHGTTPIVTLPELCSRLTQEIDSLQRSYGFRAVKRRRYDILATSLVRRLNASFKQEFKLNMPSVIACIVSTLVPKAQIDSRVVQRIVIDPSKHKKK